MPAFHLAWLAPGDGGQRCPLVTEPALGPPPFSVHGPARVLVHPCPPPGAGEDRDPQGRHDALNPLDAAGPPARLALDFTPAEASLSLRAAAGVSHFFRLADATVRPLLPEPGPLHFARGDAYVALLPAGAALPPETRLAAARFIHLRDYFNAQKLAAALYEHLRNPDSGPPAAPDAAGVLVVELR